jgi:hypothetical protein
MIEAIGFRDSLAGKSVSCGVQAIPVTNQRTASIVALTLIAFIVLVSSALGASAGDEYLPQLPDSGGSSLGGGSSGAGSSDAGSSGGSTSGSSPAPAGTGTVAPQTDGSGPQARETHKPAKKGHKSNRQQALALASDPGGGGGDGSGSILLSPLVIAMIAAVVAAAVGMTLSRRKGDHEGAEGERRPKGGRLEADGPRTPDGEIIAGPDQAT